MDLKIINQPTHILNNSSSCIDLLFTTQRNNLVMESGVHSSLQSNCHHQIIYARFNLKIYFAPPHSSPMKVKSGIIKKRILSWERAFHRKNINEKVFILNNTINNVLSNFIPHETITCNDKKPPWFNKSIMV